MKIKEVFGIEEVVTSSIRYVSDKLPPDKDLIYGLELEIENATPDWGEVIGWSSTEDGSLRNDGWEFISEPMNFNSIVDRLNAFFSYAIDNGFDPTDNSHYSERTSIHVHTNCQDLTLEQLSSILLLYQVTEDLLFHYEGNNRQDNIFCVPWSQTQYTYDIVNNLNRFICNSSIERNKYTALNLVPLTTQGTIEWRHMAGGCNLVKIENWLRLIGHYYRVARQYTFLEIQDKLVNLNSNSQYDWLLDWLFQDISHIVKCPIYRQLLENGVLNMKYSIINTKNKSPLVPDMVFKLESVAVETPF